MKTHLNFIKDDSYKGKTERYKVYSLYDETLLGEIKWYGSWRQYVLFAEPECIWSWDCLVEVSNFIKNLMEKRK